MIVHLDGTLAHTDEEAETAGRVCPFRDTAAGEPGPLAMPLGGLIGAGWDFPPVAKKGTVEWFQRWFALQAEP